MKQVKSIPEIEVTVRHDPWLDKVLDGTLRLLGEADWKARYKTTRSAASAIQQAAQKRGIAATVAIRGTDLYVQGRPGEKPATKPAKKASTRKAAVRKAPPKKAPELKSNPLAKKAPARKAVAKVVPPPDAQVA